MTKPETIDVLPASPWPARARGVLASAQSVLLAFYKREYVSRDSHPPLTYRIEVHAEPFVKGRPSSMLATYHVSPDSIREDPSPSGRNLRGDFFQIGCGWVCPEPGFNRASLWLQPRPGQVRRHMYQFVP